MQAVPIFIRVSRTLAADIVRCELPEAEGSRITVILCGPGRTRGPGCQWVRNGHRPVSDQSKVKGSNLASSPGGSPPLGQFEGCQQAGQQAAVTNTCGGNGLHFKTSRQQDRERPWEGWQLPQIWPQASALSPQPSACKASKALTPDGGTSSSYTVHSSLSAAMRKVCHQSNILHKWGCMFLLLDTCASPHAGFGPSASEITSLPLWDTELPSPQYSGYIVIPGTTKHMFYNLIVSEGDPSSDPLVVRYRLFHFMPAQLGSSWVPAMDCLKACALKWMRRPIGHE